MHRAGAVLGTQHCMQRHSMTARPRCCEPATGGGGPGWLADDDVPASSRLTAGLLPVLPPRLARRPCCRLPRRAQRPWSSVLESATRHGGTLGAGSQRSPGPSSGEQGGGGGLPRLWARLNGRPASEGRTHRSDTPVPSCESFCGHLEPRLHSTITDQTKSAGPFRRRQKKKINNVAPPVAWLLPHPAGFNGVTARPAGNAGLHCGDEGRPPHPPSPGRARPS